ncbi:DUF539 domain-containing protein [Salinisphaera aquimarina]|uniref:DUF539 domain-containing protein n=1 Tax=Salinisphaera aquimarina TaxID=2094031 RepID=A0ABV7ESK9_9GAMM
MTQFLALMFVVFGVMALVVGAMAIGVMVTGREIKGSCGGVGGGDCACSKGGSCPPPDASKSL